VLGDQQHSVDGKLARPERHGVCHSVGNPELISIGPFSTRVARGHLVGIHRQKLHAWTFAVPVERLGLKQPADDHVGMRVLADTR